MLDWLYGLRRSGYSEIDIFRKILRDKRLMRDYKSLYPETNFEEIVTAFENFSKVENLSKEYLNRERILAMKYLTDKGFSWLVPEVKKLFDLESHEVVQGLMIRFLGKYGGEDIYSYLFDLYKKMLPLDAGFFREEIVNIFVRVENKDFILPYLKVMVNDPDLSVRSKILDRLALFEDRALFPIFLNFLDPDSNSFNHSVSYSALEGIARLKDRRAIPALKKLLNYYSSDENFDWNSTRSWIQEMIREIK